MDGKKAFKLSQQTLKIIFMFHLVIVGSITVIVLLVNMLIAVGVTGNRRGGQY